METKAIVVERMGLDTGNGDDAGGDEERLCLLSLRVQLLESAK